MRRLTKLAPESASLTVKAHEYAQIVLALEPAGAPLNIDISFESDNESVAFADNCGTVQAVAPGTCTITVTDWVTETSAEVSVTVLENPDPDPDNRPGQQNGDGAASKPGVNTALIIVLSAVGAAAAVAAVLIRRKKARAPQSDMEGII